ncbi:MAG: PD40 domain-containing protein [Phaeodactylibacter sp.]|nr:PD40 domain-containing protein [Phaeodactylibacter sp.]MCB9276242.1 PD40 domain-containing protein [Lewinellaceae bacterium]
MRTTILSVLAALLAFSSGYSQSLEKVLKVGEESFNTKDYYSAFRCYETVLQYAEAAKFKGDTLYIKYKYAEAARRFNNYHTADSMYTRLWEEAKSLNPDLYARAVFNLARVKQTTAKDSINLLISRLNTERLENARELYQLFLSDNLAANLDATAEDKEAFRQAANDGIQSCTYALEHPEALTTDTIYRLGGGINTQYSDLAPVLEGNTLYYSSLKYYGEREKQSRQSRTYSKGMKADFVGTATGQADTIIQLLPENGPYNEDDIHTVHSAFTDNGRWMFFSRCYQEKDTIRCTLYRQERRGDSWGKPQRLSINADSTRFTSQQPSISRDGLTGKEWLFFASDRPGSEGGLDIWRAELDTLGNPGQPQPLSAINTRWQEATPFYHTLSGQLYFSSDREPGYGLYDMFTSFFDGEHWSDPENLGLPYNSGYNDQYYFLSFDGSQAYFSSDRPESMRFIDSLNACCQDIYSYPIKINMQLEVKATGCGEDITDIAQVMVYDITPGMVDTADVPLNEVRRYHQYRIEVIAEGYRLGMDTISLGQEYRGQDTASIALNLEPQLVDLYFTAYDPENPKFTFEGDQLEIRVNGDSPPAGSPPGSCKVDPRESVYLYIRADYKAYLPIDTALSFNTIDPDGDCVEQMRLPLSIAPPPDTLIVFYFDNDKPDRDRPSPTDRDRKYWPLTKFSFEETFEPYYAKKGAYLAYILKPDTIRINEAVRARRYTVGDEEYLRVGRDSVQVKQEGRNLITVIDTFAMTRRVDDVFDTELKGGLENLQGLCAYLEDFVATGRSFEMEVQGFCSIRGNSDYNDSLANRRILCIRLSLERYNNGVLKPYIDNHTLRLVPKALGASQAASIFPNPTMNPNKDAGGIYSLSAVLDRRVELKVTGSSIKFADPDTQTSSRTNTQNPRQ